MEIIKTRHGFLNITLKLANMRKEASFTIYPYTGGDDVIIQSSNRFCRINIRNGNAIINKKGKDSANSITLQIDPFGFNVGNELCQVFQSYFWHNDGKTGGCSLIPWENKQLFSN